MKKILVIDGNSIINRAFYGIRPLTTKSGKHTNAIYGMINIVSRQMKALSPDYAAVTFDLKAPTFRHKMYDHYKEGRHPTPPELLSQFADAKECLALMGLKVLELEGYEADDIQGTVARMAHTADEPTESYILSGDRDLLQLIDDKTTVLLAGNSDTTAMREAEFTEKYGVRPDQFVDMKALMGDSSDNIPGVAGVGEKTAANLIKTFGSLDGIYENIDDKQISKGVREKLIRDKENAYLSQTLARILTDAPIGKTLEDLAFTGPDKAGLYAKFTELELASFITKFGLDKPDEAAPTEGEDVKYTFTEAEADSIIKNAGERFAIEVKGDKLYLCNKMEQNLVFSGDFSVLSPLFEDKEIICYDAKSLIHLFEKVGVKAAGKTRFLDLMMYGYLLNPGGERAESRRFLLCSLARPSARTSPVLRLCLRLKRSCASASRRTEWQACLTRLNCPSCPFLQIWRARASRSTARVCSNTPRRSQRWQTDLSRAFICRQAVSLTSTHPSSLARCFS